MDINKIVKRSPIQLGFIQAILIAAYTAKIGGFFYFMEKTNFEPGFFGVFLMLTLLVFSAAVTGSLVFVIPVYLAINKDPQKAISILGYTLFFIFLIISVTLISILSLS